MASGTFNAARQSFPFVLISSVVLIALFFVRYFVSPYPIEQPYIEGMPLAEWLTRWSVVHYVWSSMIGFILVVCTGFVVMQLSASFVSVASRNYLPIPIFIIAACGIFVPAEALASYLAAWLLSLATRQFMLTFRKDYRFTEAFKGGFYLGFIPLLYAPAAVLLALIPIVATLYRRSGRELTVGITGALLPILGAWFIDWARGEGVWHLFGEWWRCVAHRGAPLWPTELPVMAIVCGGIIIALYAIALGWFIARRKGMRTRRRKVMIHISVTFLLLALSFALAGSSLTGLPLLAVANSITIPYSFTGRQSVVSSVLYILLIATTLVMNICSLFDIAPL
jgi:hypothetical protein